MYDKVELRVLVLATASRSSGLDRRLSYASCRLIVLAGRVRGVACKEQGAVVPSCVRVCFGYKPRSQRKVRLHLSWRQQEFTWRLGPCRRGKSHSVYFTFVIRRVVFNYCVLRVPPCAGFVFLPSVDSTEYTTTAVAVPVLLLTGEDLWALSRGAQRISFFCLVFPTPD